MRPALASFSRAELGRFLQSACQAARVGGRCVERARGNGTRYTLKGEINVVTRADRLSERAIRKYLLARFPSHGFLAEEEGRRGRRSDFVWVVDPLDGTTNYARGFPMYCVSVALVYRGQSLVGAVYHPTTREIFTAARGLGAYRDGKRIRVSGTRRLGRAFLATGFPYDIRKRGRGIFRLFRRFCLRVLAVRRAGAAALDLCYLAAGVFDGFWEFRLHAWDIAAAGLVVEEAGGRLSDFSGNGPPLDGRQVLASNGLLHPEMLEVIQNTAE